MEEERFVIFDMDGTLLRLPVDWGRVNDGLRRLYKTESASSPLLPTVRRLAGTNVEILHRALEIIGWEERGAVPRLEVAEEARELLGELKARGYHLALVTLQGEEAAKMALGKSGLVDFFEEVVTRSTALERFDQILEARKGFGGRAVVVGDRINDAASAKEVGCFSILVRPGGGDVPEADLVVESFDRDVESILQGIDSYLRPCT